VRVLEVSYSREVWGAELAMMALAGPLAERGIDVTLGSAPGGALESSWRGLGLPFLPLALPHRFGLRPGVAGGSPSPYRLVRELAVSARSVRLIGTAAKGADVLYSNSLWAHLDCALAGRISRRPVLLELCDMVRPGPGRKVLTAAARLSTTAVAISKAVADCVGPLAADRVRLVPQAVDLARFGPGRAPELRRRLTSDERAPLVGIVGRIDPEKGVDVLVRAMASLQGPAADAHLVVVGAPATGPHGFAERVRTEAEKLLGERVRFVGRSDDVPQVLKALDVLVNASAAEPFGLSVLEAQATGVAVIGTRAGGIPDFVFDGDNGLLVPSGDVEAMTRALEKLIADPELRGRLAARGRVSASELGVERRADSLADICWDAARARVDGHGSVT
jgi:D-inositol-3-phosphate glycosyltransferase